MTRDWWRTERFSIPPLMVYRYSDLVTQVRIVIMAWLLLLIFLFSISMAPDGLRMTRKKRPFRALQTSGDCWSVIKPLSLSLIFQYIIRNLCIPRGARVVKKERDFWTWPTDYKGIMLFAAWPNTKGESSKIHSCWRRLPRSNVVVWRFEGHENSQKIVTTSWQFVVTTKYVQMTWRPAYRLILSTRGWGDTVREVYSSPS